MAPSGTSAHANTPTLPPRLTRPSTDEKKRPAALNLSPTRTGTGDSWSSSDSSLKQPRTPRFNEATTVYSPVEARSPFADPQSQPGVVGFGYISSNQEKSGIPMPPKSPLKSAMKVPGTPARTFTNPLSPTFREEEMLEKHEGSTDKQQARDLKIKTRVRMAKFALRGVNFSCSLIILAMMSSSFAIFNATKALPAQSKMPSWAQGTDTWPQKLVLSMSCVSLFSCFVVFIAYCRGGHKRAEKVGTYYTMFAIAWFIFSMIMWVITAGVFQNSKNNSQNKDMWGWSCVDNTRADVFSQKVDYALVCRLQNWSLICIIIEVVVEVICIALYSIVFYRYYSKRKLHKSMTMRDRARSDLYLAQLRVQSAPNTPGFGPKSPMFAYGGPKSPALSNYAMSPRHPPAAYGNLGDIEEATSPFTPGGRIPEPTSQFNKPSPTFKLEAPPRKAPSATPKTAQGAFTPTAARAPSPVEETVQSHGPSAADEPTYDAVPIPGAYVASPPPTRTTF